MTAEEELEIREQIVAQAKKLKNVPFAHRGRTRFGIDCLGLCLVSYRRAGFGHLPDSDGKIYPINWFLFEKDERYLDFALKFFNKVKEPKMGDIVMFRCYDKKTTHAGIYLGKDEFIHAFSGRQVQINNLTEKYYKHRLSYILRIKEFSTE